MVSPAHQGLQGVSLPVAEAMKKLPMAASDERSDNLVTRVHSRSGVPTNMVGYQSIDTDAGSLNHVINIFFSAVSIIRAEGACRLAIAFGAAWRRAPLASLESFENTALFLALVDVRVGRGLASHPDSTFVNPEQRRVPGLAQRDFKAPLLLPHFPPATPHPLVMLTTARCRALAEQK